jgi:hypothetical protein
MTTKQKIKKICETIFFPELTLFLILLFFIALIKVIPTLLLILIIAVILFHPKF